MEACLLADDSALRQLFVYGSLVDPRCLDDVLGHRHPGERLRARLGGYERVSSEAYAYPYIVQVQQGWVEGVLIMDLSPYDMCALDRYEDVQTGMYRRQLVEVEAWGCSPRPIRLQAHTYVAGPGLLESTARQPNRNI
jgi:gamma-glutamylcyclotransferase (GGCT)/AIG2-like uncharacterized protein YtfP